MSKLPNINTSIFAVMTSLAEKYNAVNLSQGFPNFDPPKRLIELVNHYMNNGRNQYAPMSGTLQLRQALNEKYKKYYNAQYDIEKEITITAGGTQALFTAITAFIEPGDEVIIFEPAYDSYIPSIIINGGKPVPIQLDKNFNIDWNEVQSKISQKTKMLIINSPHNPSGNLLSENDLAILSELIADKNILILSDEVYEHIVFDEYKHCSLINNSMLAEKTIVVYSFGKTYHATGWKIGCVFAKENIMKEFRKVHQFNVFTVNTPIQLALADFMKDENHFLSLGKFYQQKRDYFLQQIANSRFEYVPSKGTYFQLLDYSEISDATDTDFAMGLIKDYGVAVIPLSPFFSQKNDLKKIRICFAKTNDVLESAAKILTEV